jgi:hypothetical protein
MARRCGRPGAGRITKIRAPKIRARWEGKMLGKARIMAIAAATLLASPAFAGWPTDQAAQLDLVGGQRIIREIVVDGHLIETDSDDAPASELRPAPSLLDESLGLPR